MAIDSRGNVVVTGFAKKASGTDDQFYTAKYDALNGRLLWERIETTVNEMSPTSIAIDSTDAIIVAGSRNSGGTDDFCIFKYNSDGTPAFAQPLVYDGTAGGQDVPAKVVVDGNNNIIICGRSVGESGSQFDFYVRRYNSQGVFQAPDIRLNPNNRSDIATDMVVDGTSNTIVVGSITSASGDPLLHILSLSPTFSTNWQKTIDTGGRGGATAVAVDAAGSVYTTGIYANAAGHRGFYTIKYNSAGVFQWDQTVLPTLDDFTGAPVSISIGSDGHPVVAGTLENESSTRYIRLVKYDSETGSIRWDTTDNGFIGEESVARQAITDGTSNTILIGESVNSHGAQNSFNHLDVCTWPDTMRRVGSGFGLAATMGASAPVRTRALQLHRTPLGTSR